ncbi:variant erythrocyte surface antigen-1 family protein [Babesia caballi]|uniref:Variant erythrocyte surface antigen-1 family protein n=1 Tax=Babesia caballi TaxID=5871 RepID=A0AAV4LMM2_BABCB|nr:variant erythrocyte surface antigen-1 family protein [Babesia caballi]
MVVHVVVMAFVISVTLTRHIQGLTTPLTRELQHPLVTLIYPLSTPCRPLLDCPSNLKEAIDWILRVTGKDGGQGGDKSAELAKAVVGLPDFQEAITAAAGKLKESGVSVALQKLQDADALKGIIGKLAEGLATFIGYGGKGQGIALVIDPLQQLRKGVLSFLLMMLDKLRTLSVDDKGAIEALGKARMGTDTFESALDKVKKINQGTAYNNKIPEVVRALQNTEQLKQSKGDRNKFPEEVGKYLKGVLEAVKAQTSGQVDTLCTHFPALIRAYGNNGDISRLTGDVKDANAKLNSRGLGQPAKSIVEGINMGTANLLTQLKKDGYKSSYSSTLTWTAHFNTKSTKAAQIFLGCLPLYYYWLTYLYWKCEQPQKEGGWENMAFSGRGGGFALKHFLVGQGYNGSYLNTQNGSVRGSSIATLIEALGMSSVTNVTQPSHPDMLTELNKSLQGVIGSSGSTELNDHSLSALFHLCRCYFTGKQIINPVTERKSPTSIREMLYWLSGLQFSPHYSDLKEQVDAFIPDNGLHVADSGITTSNNMITRDQMKGFLLTSCLSAPGVLGAIQGNAADSKEPEGEPWLYSLFCNSMNLQYPSGSAIFNTLANYAYALQFQLYFLYIQCRTNHNQSYGWQWCRYGQSAQPSGSNSEELASWICKAPDCGLGHGCQHNSETCQHFQQCGQFDKRSPLQAFLTDNLKGFHVSQKPDADSTHHLDNHPPGSMCHVPMGFDGTLTKDPNATGWYIYYLLEHFCSGPKTPLRQLCEKLGCLTKRTPRTLGDLFGFLWHLNGQLFHSTRPTRDILARKLVNAIGENNKSKTIPQFLFDILKKAALPSSFSGPSANVLSRSFETMAPTIPFLYQLFMGDPKDFLPTVLFDLKGTTHKGIPSHTGPHNNLYSLQNPGCSEPNCGTYMSPLCYSNGSAFAPKHASSYFSWVVYLVDDLETGLRDMLDEFTNIDCKKSGCHEQKCQGEHGPGQHGSSDAQCQCESVVQCGGVLPILYSNGFNFASAGFLKNGASQPSGQPRYKMPVDMSVTHVTLTDSGQVHLIHK